MVQLWWNFYGRLIIVNKKRDKIAFKTAYNRVREVRWTILKVDWSILPGFEVQGGKRTFMKVEGCNVDFFLLWLALAHDHRNFAQHLSPTRLRRYAAARHESSPRRRAGGSNGCFGKDTAPTLSFCHVVDDFRNCLDLRNFYLHFAKVQINLASI